MHLRSPFSVYYIFILRVRLTIILIIITTYNPLNNRSTYRIYYRVKKLDKQKSILPRVESRILSRVRFYSPPTQPSIGRYFILYFFITVFVHETSFKSAEIIRNINMSGQLRIRVLRNDKNTSIYKYKTIVPIYDFR